MNPLADKTTRMRFNKAMRAKDIPARACNTCFAVKGHAAFAADRSKPDGRNSRCKECAREYNAQWYAVNAERKREYRAANADRERETAARWYAANADRARENMAQWRAANPDKARALKQRRRARKANVPHEPYSRTDIFARWGNACCYCDAPAEHLDHVHPISRGGADAPHNLVPACPPCNNRKHAKTLAEWAATF